MAVPPRPGQQEYVYDNTRERIGNKSFTFVVPGMVYLYDWRWMLCLLIALVGLVGNGAVLWLLGFRIPRNPFSVYILNLAGADALFLSFSFLISMFETISYYPFMYALFIFLADTSYGVGLSLLAAISTGRCLAVLFPSWYLHHRPKNTSADVCAVLWALAGLFWASDLVLCFYIRSRVLCDKFSRVPVVWFIHFTPVMGGSSLTLLLRVQCSAQRQQPPRLYLLVLLMVLLFLLCGLPTGFQEGMSAFGLNFMPYWFLTLLACLKSSAYPFIYFLLGSRRHRRGRDPLRVVLQRALADEQELKGETRDTHPPNTLETSF